MPQSGAQLSKLSIIIAQRTETQETILCFFCFLTGYHPDTLISAPSLLSCHFPIVYPLMRTKISNLGIIYTEVQHVFIIQSYCFPILFPVFYLQTGEKELHYLDPWKLNLFFVFEDLKYFTSDVLEFFLSSPLICCEHCEGIFRT